MTKCHSCGFTGDDIQDFISTDYLGERIYPKCNSKECYIIEVPEG